MTRMNANHSVPATWIFAQRAQMNFGNGLGTRRSANPRGVQFTKPQTLPGPSEFCHERGAIRPDSRHS